MDIGLADSCDRLNINDNINDNSKINSDNDTTDCGRSFVPFFVIPVNGHLAQFLVFSLALFQLLLVVIVHLLNLFLLEPLENILPCPVMLHVTCHVTC